MQPHHAVRLLHGSVAVQSHVLRGRCTLRRRAPLHGPDGATHKEGRVPALLVGLQGAESVARRGSGHQATGAARGRTPRSPTDLFNLYKAPPSSRPSRWTQKSGDFSSTGRYGAASLGRNEREKCILSLTGGDLRMPQPPPSTVSPHAAPPLPALPTVPFRQMHPVVCQGDPVREFPLRVHLLPPAGDATDISTDSAGPSSWVPPHVWPPGGTARMQGRPHAAQMSHGPPPPLTGCR